MRDRSILAWRSGSDLRILFFPSASRRAGSLKSRLANARYAGQKRSRSAKPAQNLGPSALNAARCVLELRRLIPACHAGAPHPSQSLRGTRAGPVGGAANARWWLTSCPVGLPTDGASGSSTSSTSMAPAGRPSALPAPAIVSARCGGTSNPIARSAHQDAAPGPAFFAYLIRSSSGLYPRPAAQDLRRRARRRNSSTFLVQPVFV
jgi:hypothetical protein